MGMSFKLARRDQFAIIYPHSSKYSDYAIFTRMRQMLADDTDLHLEVEKIKTKLNNQNKNMEIVFRYQ